MASRSKKFHKWTIDFTGANRGKGDKQLALTSQTSLARPYGYAENVNVKEVDKKEADSQLIVKKSWDVALGPLKQIPMNFFIMWMAGNTISIFPIMMVGMMFFRPIQALMSASNTAFKMIEGSQHILQKFVYMFGNIVCLALAVYKCQTMGLLPTTPSDWLAFVEAQRRLEWSGGGALL
ncbi:ER membrane protein complex subunit 4-like [Mercenaria mercenaria]|uniref:ER membrane protein complex subunit 4-like n=1 Tax=Mercenaria mercenaria TaxID=6596 RepID=UPI001E1D936D|nr:ER membrane protein complex subunit 4-like [Mercenaria mercenaria]